MKASLKYSIFTCGAPVVPSAEIVYLHYSECERTPEEACFVQALLVQLALSYVLVPLSVNRTLKRCLIGLDMGNKRGMVALGLICICFGESSNCLIEHIFFAQIAADQCRVT